MSDEELAELKTHFGSFFQTIFTLFQSISGGMDWGGPAEALLPAGWAYTTVFCLYISVTVVAVLNVVTGIFVESAMKSAQHDRHTVIQDHLAAKQNFTEDVREIFNEADTDG